MNDLVSIVLPVYNGAKYLRESIDSVINQTYTNWELLILDDCSTDETPQIAKEYVALDSRIHYHRNEQNLRLPGNLNKGFSIAQGAFLTWTSDDNRYRPEALEKMIAALKEKNAQFVFASCRIIDSDGKEIEYIMVHEGIQKQIVGSNPVGACFMYTREVYETIGDYDETLTLVEDMDYWQRVFMKFDICTISDILYDYRWHDGALTSTMRKDEFNLNLEKMLLKNVRGFGKLNILQKYFFFKALYGCRNNIGSEENPYRLKYRIYAFFYLILYRVPKKLARKIKENK